jgi:single-strand DNA-binding protein
MSRGLNKVLLIGRLGANPEIRYTPDGNPVATFTVATNESYTNRNGERITQTEWHRVVVFGKLAEIVGEYYSKGKKVYVEGKLRTRQWEDRNGNKRWTTEIVANNLFILDSKGEEFTTEDTTIEDTPINDDDIPF